MDHYAVICRATGEHHFVITEKGKKPSAHGVCGKSTRFVKLDREPGEADKFDGKKLVRCDETAALIAYEARLNTMSRAEFMDEVLRRVASLNKS